MIISRAIRNLYQLVLLHHNKENEKIIDVDTDHQLKIVKHLFYIKDKKKQDLDQIFFKVEEFVNDLTKITNEISREGLNYYTPPSSN